MRLVIRGFVSILLLLAALTVTLLSFLPPPGEYEIVSIDPGSWVVSARGEDGGSLSFGMHPSIFQGRCFNANLNNVSEGSRFSIVGPPGERFDRLEARSVTGRGAGVNRTIRQRPRRPDTRGMQRWCIEEVDAAQQTVTAAASGKRIRFRVDSGSFRGYRLQVPSIGELAAGGRFTMSTPNDVPVRCCTLLEGP